MSAVSGFDSTTAGLPGSSSRTAAEDVSQRLEEVLAMGFRRGEGVLELRSCLDELADNPVLVPDHPDVITAHGHLAYWTWQDDDIAQARELFAALVPDIERTLGPHHRRSLDVRRRWAGCTGWTGAPAAARNLYAELIPVAELSLGTEHRDVVHMRREFAAFTGQAGDRAGARDLYLDLIPVAQRVLGPDHIDTLSARMYLAACTEVVGDPTGAQDLYAALLPDMERALGAQHPRTRHVCRTINDWADKNKTARP